MWTETYPSNIYHLQALSQFHHISSPYQYHILLFSSHSLGNTLPFPTYPKVTPYFQPLSSCTLTCSGSMVGSCTSVKVSPLSVDTLICSQSSSAFCQTIFICQTLIFLYIVCFVIRPLFKFKFVKNNDVKYKKIILNYRRHQRY